MADRLISELNLLALGDVDAADWVEIHEADEVVSKKTTVNSVTKIERDEREVRDDAIEASVGLSAAGAYVQPVGSNYLDTSTDVMNALDILDNIAGVSNVITEIVSVSAANLNNAWAAPYELISAPGATAVIELIAVSIRLLFDTTQVQVGSDKLVIEYDTGANHFVEWSNGFIESGSTVINKGTWTSNVTMLLNKKLQLTFDGAANPTAGDSTLKVFLTYKIWNWDV